jgi:preprotein translocase subunit SecF
MNPPTSPDPSTVGVIYSWTNNPMIVAILFGFAGTVFVGIYLLRSWRNRRKAGGETKVV